MRQLRIALAGNPNCGKTTLFNALTGAAERVGNFPGVTMEKKQARLRGGAGALLTDLPGVYSLSPYSAEERAARDHLLDERPDAVICVADATALGRSLYLAGQLLELGIPTVLCCNMMDEARQAGIRIDLAGLSAALGCPVLPVCALRGEGTRELAQAALRAAAGAKPPAPPASGTGPEAAALRALEALLAPYAADKGLPLRHAAAKLCEGDALISQRLALPRGVAVRAEGILLGMERALGADREAAMAAWRYRAADAFTARFVREGGASPARARSERLDRVLADRRMGLPVLGAVLALIFFLAFGPVGGALSGLLERGAAAASAALGAALARAGVAPLVCSLILEGAVAGVGSVLCFLPTVLALFLFLSLLEDTGYLARAVFLMDGAMRRIGLSGRSLVPLIAGFGCTVPAVMAARGLPAERDRKMTALLAPFASCSAKLSVYAVFTAAFFGGRGGAVTAGLYLLGVLAGALYARFFRGTVFPGDGAPLLLELPNYRFPTARSTARLLWGRAKEFLSRAFTVVFLASLVVWAAGHFAPDLTAVADPADSLLAAAGRLLAPCFAPLGFGDWRVCAALLTGLAAKETVLSTLAVLTGAGAGESLAAALRGILAPPAALACLAFILLYMPCAAAVNAIRRELGSPLSALLAVLCQTGFAWLCAFAVYRLAILFF